MTARNPGHHWPLFVRLFPAELLFDVPTKEHREFPVVLLRESNKGAIDFFVHLEAQPFRCFVHTE